MAALMIGGVFAAGAVAAFVAGATAQTVIGLVTLAVAFAGPRLLYTLTRKN